MTINIHIEVPLDRDPKAYLDEMMHGLGFERIGGSSSAVAQAFRDATVTGMGVTVTQADGSVERVSPEEMKAPEEPKKVTRTRKAKTEEPVAAISTGEERVGPEDAPETAAQDAADEQAEVEAARDPEKPLTGDDLRNAMGAYVNKFGMPETQEDGPAIFAAALGTPPDGEQFWKLTVVAGKGQDTLKKAIDAWTAAAAAGKRYGKAA